MTTHAVAVEVKRRTCLVVAPPAADLSIVRRLLRDREVEPLMLAEVPPIGVTVLDQLTRALARSEVVIFVLSTPNADANVYFEIGLARGQGKRLMILAPEGTTHIPGDIRELLVVKAQLDDDEAIGFSLDQLLAAPSSVPTTTATVANEIAGRSLGDLADALIQRAESLRDRLLEQHANADAYPEFKQRVTYWEIEQIVMEALQASHVTPVVASQGRDPGDLAAWVDELDSIGLNPLLIELKLRLDRTGTTDKAVEQASAFLRGNRAGAVLIVSLVGPRADETAPSSANNIIHLDLLDLLHRMRTRSFGAVMRAELHDGAAAVAS